ncbi:uncharacterized protein BX663DRAFT_565017 [Cokeromyces recurvatus]|uniref:uncharacterized protein n=1 Tax=Cokeromyces recurvatus TaxID=90255 RepID=UPI00221F23CB|nr:uncharacterized protein BX663DRAFT_565017 [Cokeromyces recurvatus]KAI7898092.1 hypothetical protein BX663DRAFT_565017 [Cokeromyces recurvatus]
MTIFGSLPFFGLAVSSQKKPAERIRKSIGPTLSNVLKRQHQPFSTSTVQKTISATKANRSSSNYYYKQNNNSSSSSTKGPEKVIVTEGSMLNHFPSPNLIPTLHSLLFGSNNNNSSSSPSSSSSPFIRQQQVCNNCYGPHSTDFCPC